MMRKIYILDFDGTLGDSRGLILRTMMDTFDALGIDRPTEEACVNTIGLPLADCFVVAAGLSAALPGRGGGGERLAAREFLAFAEDTGMRFNLQFNLSLSKLFLMIRSGSRRIILRYDLAARLSRIVRCGPLRQLLNKWKTKCCKNKTS